jgi:PAS domain S-box-containing protein
MLPQEGALGLTGELVPPDRGTDGRRLDGGSEPVLLGDIVAHSGEVVYRYRLAGGAGFQYVSDSVMGLVGYTPAECYADASIAGKLVHPDDANLLEEMRGGPGGTVREILIRWLHRDGGVVWTEQRYFLTRDASGAAVMLDSVVRDVTRREEERQQRLQLIQQRRLRAMPEALREARVLVADDHAVMRAGLRAILAQDQRLQVVGEAQDGREAVALATRLQPDLVLMDVVMPDWDGLQATRALKQACPMTSVLMLSMFDDPDVLLDAVRAGAAGYVLKAASEADVRAAIWEALDGNFPVDQRMAREVLERLSHEVERHPAVPPPSGPQLSAREHEVLERVARGQTNREIADELIIASNTVKIHVEHILSKLGVSDRTQAAVRAIELGYIGRSPGRTG